MIRSTMPSWVAISRSSSRPPPATRETAPSGSPAADTASEAIDASTALECAAVEEPRSTIALPDLRQSAVQSIVTFGRASYTTATTPSGTRTRRRSRPLYMRWPSIVSPTGSGRAATERVSRAIPAVGGGVSRSRSSGEASSSASGPASMSRTLASSIWSTRDSRASAIASMAAFLVTVSRRASSREARLAPAQISATDAAVVATASRVPAAVTPGRCARLPLMATVVSVNVGKPRSITRGNGEQTTTAIWKSPVSGRVAVRGVNLEGDDQADRTVHGGPDQAVYAYAIEDTEWWESELGRELGPGAFGENLTLRGVDVTHALIGERWAVGTTVLEVSSPRIPRGKLA